MVHSMLCRNLCRLYIHLAFTYILRWSLARCVKRTWTGSASSTHECLKWKGHGLSLSCVTWPLGHVYTMDREVDPRPCKICDWMLNSSQDHYGLHQGKIWKRPWSLSSPKDIFWSPTLSTNTVQHVLWWERQKRCYGWKGRGPWK